MANLNPSPMAPAEAVEKCGRSCGPCQVCCGALPVVSVKPPMDKPEMEPCEYQCDEGCRIYETKPQPCRDYYCQWITGWGMDSLRPNILGMIIEANARTKCIHVKEVREGVANSPLGSRIIADLAAQGPLTLDLIGAGEAVFIGSQEQSDEFLKILREMFLEHNELCAEVQAELDKEKV